MRNLIIFFISIITFSAFAQKGDAPYYLQDSILGEIKLRSIGPAFTSGRISDIVIHPKNENVWYVAVGSGGVWKTTNSGTTWNSIFENQGSYSIGCISINQNNPNEIWVGTGENVGGRHVGYGDGIYFSADAGKTWTNMGLKKSEHISKIIIQNDSTILVAAQGPLWSKGGERGVFKSTNKGKTWTQKLGDSEWVGATELAVDPRNQNIIYCATWQRHRNVAAYMGGGPGSGLHKSVDGGETWIKLKKGLPTSNMGKIGLAISPQNPDVLYAAIELDRRKGGVYKSTNLGLSWTKMSDEISVGTGPHYYQELWASPHQFDKIYFADYMMKISTDGGKTFNKMNEKNKHVDNHAIAFKKSDPNYLLVGTDGGLYESFDGSKTWKYVTNLPVTQFYKLALDDAKPFYNIFGGSQDNNSQGGPSQTLYRHGIANSDWFITYGGDGHQPATEPGNPNILYNQSQQGYLGRVDRNTGEIVYIAPQAGENEPHERKNWDAPVLVSPHNPKRLYVASYRLWKSDNRGDSWTAISEDLTKNQKRIELPIMGGKQSFDNPWDVYAMSSFNTITSISESPQKQGLIYVGTDDGLIWKMVEDNWSKTDVKSLPGAPDNAYVNDIKTDLFDANTTYVVLDNHKHGDLKPYLYKTIDGGKSWKSITRGLPKRTTLWRIVQDHVDPNLLFLGTEFGLYFSNNGGNNWIQLKGVPVIPLRDLAIQKRENDLVAASFGRGFFVLDDYSFLRNLNQENIKKDAVILDATNGLWYMKKMRIGYNKKGFQGDDFYTAPNPPYGATFTYYVKDKIKSLKAIRKAKEKKGEVEFPGWNSLKIEKLQPKPELIFVIKDAEGNVIRKLNQRYSTGIQRLTWDMRLSTKQPIKLNSKPNKNPNQGPKGHLVRPGKYTVTLFKKVDGVVTKLTDPKSFEITQLHNGSLTQQTSDQVADFWNEVYDFGLDYGKFDSELNLAFKKIKAYQKAVKLSNASPGSLDSEITLTLLEIENIRDELNGHRIKKEMGEKTIPTIKSRYYFATGSFGNTYGPTISQKESLELGIKMLRAKKAELKDIQSKLNEIETKLKAQGAPEIEGEF
jgi:photosystem II stability/assembly factor-like uncharacterized protein